MLSRKQLCIVYKLCCLPCLHIFHYNVQSCQDSWGKHNGWMWQKGKWQKGVASCNEKEMHLVFFFFPTIFGSMENHKIQTFTFLPLFPQQHLLSPQRAPERLLQLAQENLDTLVTEMDELLTRVSLWSHWGLSVWLKLHNDRIWIKHVWIDEL